MLKQFNLIYPLALVATFSLVFISCDKDDDDPSEGPKTEAPANSTEGGPQGVVGTWNASTYEVIECTDPNSNRSYSFDCTEEECQKFEFKEDGTVTEYDIESNGTDTETGTYEIIGDSVKICGMSAFVDNTECITFAYNIADNKLSLTGEPDADVSSPGCKAVTTLIFDN